MTRFFLLLMRLVALSLSFALSTLAAAAFFTFTLFLSKDVGGFENDPEAAILSMTVIGYMWIVTLQLAFGPALIAFTVLEAGRMTSVLSNLLAGGFCAVAGIFLFPLAENPSLNQSNGEVWVAILAAGFVGGFTHWVLAGFRAGRWMGPKREPVSYVR